MVRASVRHPLARPGGCSSPPSARRVVGRDRRRALAVRSLPRRLRRRRRRLRCWPSADPDVASCWPQVRQRQAGRAVAGGGHGPPGPAPRGRRRDMGTHVGRAAPGARVRPGRAAGPRGGPAARGSVPPAAHPGGGRFASRRPGAPGRSAWWALASSARRRVRGAVLVVDDVVTTGATLRAAESALRRPGPRRSTASRLRPRHERRGWPAALPTGRPVASDPAWASSIASSAPVKARSSRPWPAWCRTSTHSKPEMQGVERRRPAGQDPRVPPAAGQRRGPGRPAGGVVRGGAGGGVAGHRPAPLRRAADGRGRAPLRLDRRDEDRRGQDARLHPARLPQRPRRPGRPPGHRERLPGSVPRRLDGPDLPVDGPVGRAWSSPDSGSGRPRSGSTTPATSPTARTTSSASTTSATTWPPRRRTRSSAATSTPSSTRSTPSSSTRPARRSSSPAAWPTRPSSTTGSPPWRARFVATSTTRWTRRSAASSRPRRASSGSSGRSRSRTCTTPCSRTWSTSSRPRCGPRSCTSGTRTTSSRAAR